MGKSQGAGKKPGPAGIGGGAGEQPLGSVKAAHSSPRTLCPDPLRIEVWPRWCWLRMFISIFHLHQLQRDTIGQSDSFLPRDTTNLSISAGTGWRDL